MKFAERIQHLQAEGAYEVLALAQEMQAEGHDIIHLELGEPDFRPVQEITQAGITAILEEKTRYNPPSGINELRAIIAKVAGRQRGIPVSPDQVVVGPGAKPALFFPALALIEPGDEVIYPDPGFPTYAAMIGVAGGIPVPVPLSEENQFSFDLSALDEHIGDQTKMIILNSPANPTGGVIPYDDLLHIARKALEFECWILSDEIYAHLTYDGHNVPSIATVEDVADRTVIIDGFSKTYAMTGWRLGYGIMPEALARKVSLLLTHSIGCTAHFTQYAGIEAITGDQTWVAGMVAAYQERRNFLVERLNRIPGISCQVPGGAFYVFPNITGTGMKSNELAKMLLEKAGVALLPGTAFGQYGEGYLRIAYANSLENIEQALDRIEHALSS